jgi:hypothetical protein
VVTRDERRSSIARFYEKPAAVKGRGRTGVA